MFDPVKKAAIDPEEKVDKEKKLPEKQDTYDLQIGTREDECKDKENEEEEEEKRERGGLGENHRRVAEEAPARLSAKKSRHLIDGERVKMSDSDKISENSKVCVDLVAGQVGGGWQDLVEAGDVASVANELGHYHVLTGVVVHGEKRGRTIGYPTANLGVDCCPR